MEIAKLIDEYEKVATRCGEPTAQLRALEPIRRGLGALTLDKLTPRRTARYVAERKRGLHADDKVCATDDTARQELSVLKFLLIWSHRMKLLKAAAAPVMGDASVKRHPPIIDLRRPLGPLQRRFGLDRLVGPAVLDDE